MVSNVNLHPYIKTCQEHLATLRAALRDELGQDRDVLAPFKPFAKYERNGLQLGIEFRSGESISDAELEWAYELAATNLGELNQRFSPQEKMDDLCDPSSRYAFVVDAANKRKPVAFAHFRFTVEGEVEEQMAGLPVLLLRDLHIDSSIQRRGLGKHLFQLLELVARKHAMSSLSVLIPAGDAGAPIRGLLKGKLKGFTSDDVEWTPRDSSLALLSKSFAAKPAVQSAAAVNMKGAMDSPSALVANPSPDSVLCGPPANDTPSPGAGETPNAPMKTGSSSQNIMPVTEMKVSSGTVQQEAAAALSFTGFSPGVVKLENAFEQVSLASPAPSTVDGVSPILAPRKPLAFSDFGTVPADAASIDGEEADTEEDSEWEEVSENGEERGEKEEKEEEEETDDIMQQLVDLFRAKNSRDPTEEEMKQWADTLKAAAEEGGLQL